MQWKECRALPMNPADSCAQIAHGASIQVALAEAEHDMNVVRVAMAKMTA